MTPALDSKVRTIVSPRCTPGLFLELPEAWPAAEMRQGHADTIPYMLGSIASAVAWKVGVLATFLLSDIVPKATYPVESDKALMAAFSANPNID